MKTREPAAKGTAKRTTSLDNSSPRGSRSAVRDAVTPASNFLSQTLTRSLFRTSEAPHALMVTQARAAGNGEAQQALLQLQRRYGNRYIARVVQLARQGAENVEVAPSVEAAIHRNRGGGQPLDSSVRRQMESAMDADFSSVRVHTDGEADTLNRAVSARAFTVGNDLFFRQGEYNPHSSGGQELVAHELTHVLQQEGASVNGKLSVSHPEDPLEREAEETANQVVSELMTQGKGDKEEGLQASAGGQSLRRTVNRSTVQRENGDEGGGGGEAAPEGSRQNPYVSIDDWVGQYSLRVYDEDIHWNDRLFTARLIVVWDKIRWRGSTVWVPRSIRTNNTQSRGLSVGGKAEASFAAGSGATDPLRVRLLWTIAVSTPDKKVHTVKNLGGELSASQKTELAAKATVPVEGVPVEAGATAGRELGGSLNFQRTYDEEHSEGGSTVGLHFNFKSTSDGGIEVASWDYSDISNLESDSILKDLYGGWTEGDLDLKGVREGDLA